MVRDHLFWCIPPRTKDGLPGELRWSRANRSLWGAPDGKTDTAQPPRPLFAGDQAHIGLPAGYTSMPSPARPLMPPRADVALVEAEIRNRGITEPLAFRNVNAFGRRRRAARIIRGGNDRDRKLACAGLGKLVVPSAVGCRRRDNATVLEQFHRRLQRLARTAFPNRCDRLWSWWSRRCPECC